EYGPVRRPTRRSMQTLKDSGRFKFHYYMRGYLEQMRDSAKELADRIGLYRDGYLQWLQQRRLTDTFAQRIKYLSHFDESERGS
ncbi:MAG: hypothetical protein AB7N65_21690, partial [Vicinamibacterales bacterium]